MIKLTLACAILLVGCTDLETFEAECGDFEIDPGEDCLRLYRLPDTRGCEVREHGKFKATDFDAPLVL